jgi:hypothetical protein
LTSCAVSDLSVLGTPVKVGGTWFLMVLFLVVALALCRLAVVGVKVERPQRSEDERP